ncbi:MAG: serine hydrolase domain-containing protein [Actinomycetota bacterium]
MLKTVSSGLDFTSIRSSMSEYVNNDVLPYCSWVILRGTDVIDVGTIGGDGPGRTIEIDSILRMHSSTKLITSVLAMMLHEEGHFALDDPVERYLPELGDRRVLTPDAQSAEEVVPAQGSITIAQLLSHSSGLSYGFVEPTAVIDQSYAAAGLTPPQVMGHTLAELITALAPLPLAFEPGTSWRYSFATDVVARLIEVWSGFRFDDFMTERLLAPLAMTDTAFWVPPAKRDRLATMFDPSDPMRPMVPGLSPSRAEGPMDGPPAFLSGGGGLFSTLADYVPFVQMLVNNGAWNGHQLLQPETVQLMRTNQLAPHVGVQFPMWRMADTTFGLGLALKNAPDDGEPTTAAGEYHWGGMAGTHVWIAPEAGVAAICATQRMPGFWHPFSREFKRLVYQITA